MEVEPSVDTEAFSLPPQAARGSSITRIRIIQISFFLNKISLFFGFVFLYLMVSSYPFHVKSKRHNNSTYIKSLQAQIDAAKAETEAVRAELEFARAEAKAAKADAEATKAEAEAILAEAAALKAEAEALMAEAELHKSETTLGAKEIPGHKETENTTAPSSSTEDTSNGTTKQAHNPTPATGAIAGAISIASMEENEKIPKERLILYPEEYQKLGVTNFRATVLKDYDYDGYSMLAINGEYDGKTSDYLIIMPMVFNASGELIGADFDETIKQKIRSHKTYSMTLKVPNNEQIAWIEIRIVKDPTFLS